MTIVPEFVEEAIVDSQRKGMIPFILIIPVSPQAIDPAMKLDERLIARAGKEMQKQLTLWRNDEEAHQRRDESARNKQRAETAIRLSKGHDEHPH